MQAKLRYSAVLAFLTLACIIYLVAKHASAPQHRKARRSYMGSKLGHPGSSNNVLLASPSHSRAFNSTLCTMASCFDFSLCEGRPFRLYVYPLEEAVLITFKTHSKSIKQSKNTFPSCHLMWLLRVNSFSGLSFYWTHLPHTSWVGQKLPLLKTFATCKKQDLKMIFPVEDDILHSKNKIWWWCFWPNMIFCTPLPWWWYFWSKVPPSSSYMKILAALRESR